jgi:5-enolpyruvylshikimate-3-phosphate synthase
VPGAKNSVLKLMSAALLAEGTTTLSDVPDILDVRIMAELLNRLGCEVGYETGKGALSVTTPALPGHRADYDLVRAMRASISVLGPLLARCGAAEVALPGGDAIGSRGLDMHVSGLEALGRFVGAALGLDVLGSFSVPGQTSMVSRLTVEPGSHLAGLAMNELSASTRVVGLSRASTAVMEHPPRRGTRFAAGDLAYLFGPYEELPAVLGRARIG